MTLPKNSLKKNQHIFSDNPVTGSPRAEKWDASDEIRVSGTPTGSVPTLSSPSCVGTARDPRRQNAKLSKKRTLWRTYKNVHEGKVQKEPSILGASGASNDFIALVSDSKLTVNAPQ